MSRDENFLPIGGFNFFLPLHQRLKILKLHKNNIQHIIGQFSPL